MQVAAIKLVPGVSVTFRTATGEAVVVDEEGVAVTDTTSGSSRRRLLATPSPKHSPANQTALAISAQDGLYDGLYDGEPHAAHWGLCHNETLGIVQSLA